MLVIAPDAASESHRSPRAARSAALTLTRDAGNGRCQSASASPLGFLGAGDVGVPHRDPGSPKRVGERSAAGPPTPRVANAAVRLVSVASGCCSSRRATRVARVCASPAGTPPATVAADGPGLSRDEVVLKCQVRGATAYPVVLVDESPDWPTGAHSVFARCARRTAGRLRALAGVIAWARRGWYM